MKNLILYIICILLLSGCSAAVGYHEMLPPSKHYSMLVPTDPKDIELFQQGETPTKPSARIVSDVKSKVLDAWAKKKSPLTELSLGSAVKLVAKLGGYLGRNNDSPLGHQLMWNGYAILQQMCRGFILNEGDPGLA